eukprot:TRINITY_DN67274_c5_g2_i1.p1 TRINITY_DN67274_c5_g2~~TRINITY_DN67274_c5_g2_i1.p1  ORF type:complete len:916 (+),score=76.39 TRINITY_DN67274_c5_g2_i1:94-2841(+)
MQNLGIQKDTSAEQYIREMHLHNIINDCLAEILRYKPVDPINMMIEYLCKVSVPVNGSRETAGQLENTLQLALRQAEAKNSAGEKFTNKEKALTSHIAALADPNNDQQSQRTLTRSATLIHNIDQFHSLKRARSPGLYSKLVRSKKAAEMLLQTALEMTASSVDNSEKILNDVMTGAAQLLEADRCTFFLVDGNELVSSVVQGESGEIRIPIGTGLAGHVARAGEVINIPDAWRDPRFNRSVDKETGYRTESILCMPVLYEGHIVAVAQLLNKQGGPFTTEDEELFEAFGAFAGVCIRNQQLFQKVVYEQRKMEVFLAVLERLSKNTDIRDIDSIITGVVTGITELLLADRCTLFLLDAETHQLVSKIVSNAGTTKIRVPVGRGIAGTVAETRETLNIPDAYADPRFSDATDRSLGYTTKTILAMPIINANDEVVAVTQVINKLEDGGFTTRDEDMLRYFSLFAGIAISNAKLYEFVLESGNNAMSLLTKAQQVSNNQPITVVTSNFSVPTDEEIQGYKALYAKISDEEYEHMLSCQFNVHNYGLASSKHEYLIPFCIKLFESLGFIEQYSVPIDVLYRFLICVKRKYRTVPYHSITHAFDVTHTLYTYLAHNKCRETLHDLDTFVLIVSALLHDIDHMGLNNSFHLKAETPLGVLCAASGAQSVLEVHHCNLSIELLAISECNPFVNLSHDVASDCIKMLLNNILATDMARHREFLERFRKMVASGYNVEDPDHRRLACALLIKCADISNPSKPFDISRMWGIAMNEEFYLQGDAEKRRELTVTPNFLRGRTELASSQLGFINGVVKDMLELVAKSIWPGMEPILDELGNNVERWKDIMAEHRRRRSQQPPEQQEATANPNSSSNTEKKDTPPATETSKSDKPSTPPPKDKDNNASEKDATQQKAEPQKEKANK